MLNVKNLLRTSRKHLKDSKRGADGDWGSVLSLFEVYTTMDGLCPSSFLTSPEQLLTCHRCLFPFTISACLVHTGIVFHSTEETDLPPVLPLWLTCI